jgi:hypothetical protein
MFGGGWIMKEMDYQLWPVGFVRSSLISLEGCPKQGSEGAPEAWVEIGESEHDGLDEAVFRSNEYIP